MGQGRWLSQVGQDTETAGSAWAALPAVRIGAW
jgi:hypothetical protein